MEANGPTVVEYAQPTVSRASFEGWPLRWKSRRSCQSTAGSAGRDLSWTGWIASHDLVDFGSRRGSRVAINESC